MYKEDRIIVTFNNVSLAIGIISAFAVNESPKAPFMKDFMLATVRWVSVDLNWKIESILDTIMPGITFAYSFL